MLLIKWRYHVTLSRLPTSFRTIKCRSPTRHLLRRKRPKGTIISWLKVGKNQCIRCYFINVNCVASTVCRVSYLVMLTKHCVITSIETLNIRTDTLESNKFLWYNVVHHTLWVTSRHITSCHIIYNINHFT